MRTLSWQIENRSRSLLSPFCDILSSLTGTSGDGAADRRVRSDSEETADGSGRNFDRLGKKTWIRC